MEVDAPTGARRESRLSGAGADMSPPHVTLLPVLERVEAPSLAFTNHTRRSPGSLPW